MQKNARSTIFPILYYDKELKFYNFFLIVLKTKPNSLQNYNFFSMDITRDIVHTFNKTLYYMQSLVKLISQILYLVLLYKWIGVIYLRFWLTDTKTAGVVVSSLHCHATGSGFDPGLGNVDLAFLPTRYHLIPKLVPSSLVN